MDDASSVSYAETIASQSFNSAIGSASAEKINKRIFTMESEIATLKREKAVLVQEIDFVKGKDEKEAFANIVQKYDNERSRSHEYEEKYIALTRQFREYQDENAKEIEIHRETNKKLQEKCRSLERENITLQEQIENDKSLIYKLENEHSVAQNFFADYSSPVKLQEKIPSENEIETPKVVNQKLEKEYEALAVTKNQLELRLLESNENFMAFKKEIEQEFKEKEVKIAQLEQDLRKYLKVIKSLYAANAAKEEDNMQKLIDDVGQELNDTNQNVTDADQIAASMLVLLENIDKNQRNTADLQGAIIDFLAEKGMKAKGEGVASFMEIFRTLVDRRRKQIKTDNKMLVDEYRGQNHVLDNCLQQLDDDSLMVSMVSQDVSVASCPLDATRNLNTTSDEFAAARIMSRTSTIAEVCVELFEKLRGTAEFFQTLLKALGENDEALLAKISELQIDLDKSLCEAKSIYVEAKNAEKSFRNLMEKSVNTSAFAFNTSAGNVSLDESNKETNGLSFIPFMEPQQLVCQKCQFYDNVKQTLNNELANKEALLKRIKELEEEKNKLQETSIPNKAIIVNELKGEMNKICDTLNFASTKCETLKKRPRGGNK